MKHFILILVQHTCVPGVYGQFILVTQNQSRAFVRKHQLRSLQTQSHGEQEGGSKSWDLFSQSWHYFQMFCPMPNID